MSATPLEIVFVIYSFTAWASTIVGFLFANLYERWKVKSFTPWAYEKGWVAFKKIDHSIKGLPVEYCDKTHQIGDGLIKVISLTKAYFYYKPQHFNLLRIHNGIYFKSTLEIENQTAVLKFRLPIGFFISVCGMLGFCGPIMLFMLIRDFNLKTVFFSAIFIVGFVQIAWVMLWIEKKRMLSIYCGIHDFLEK